MLCSGVTALHLIGLSDRRDGHARVFLQNGVMDRLEALEPVSGAPFGFLGCFDAQLRNTRRDVFICLQTPCVLAIGLISSLCIGFIRCLALSQCLGEAFMTLVGENGHGL